MMQEKYSFWEHQSHQYLVLLSINTRIKEIGSIFHIYCPLSFILFMYFSVNIILKSNNWTDFPRSACIHSTAFQTPRRLNILDNSFLYNESNKHVNLSYGIKWHKPNVDIICNILSILMNIEGVTLHAFHWIETKEKNTLL